MALILEERNRDGSVRWSTPCHKGTFSFDYDWTVTVDEAHRMTRSQLKLDQNRDTTWHFRIGFGSK